MKKWCLQVRILFPCLGKKQFLICEDVFLLTDQLLNLEGNHLDVCLSFCYPMSYPENEILKTIYTHTSTFQGVPIKPYGELTLFRSNLAPFGRSRYVYKLTYFTSLLPFAIKTKTSLPFHPKIKRLQQEKNRG